VGGHFHAEGSGATPRGSGLQGGVRAGPRSRARLALYAHLRAFYAWLGRRSTMVPVRQGTPTGSRVLVPASPHSDGRPADDPPARPVDYAALSAGWGAALATVLLASRDKGEEPVRPAEIVPLGVATFALSKLVAKEKVDRWVREPFVEEGPDGERRPKGRGLRYAVGELLTCTRCTGAWSALALIGLRLHAPAIGRTVATVLATSAGNDFMHAAFSYVCARANADKGEAASRPAAVERRAA
jgi:uncharacterized protein DUF1360